MFNISAFCIGLGEYDFLTYKCSFSKTVDVFFYYIIHNLLTLISLILCLLLSTIPVSTVYTISLHQISHERFTLNDNIIGLHQDVYTIDLHQMFKFTPLVCRNCFTLFVYTKCLHHWFTPKFYKIALYQRLSPLDLRM